MSNPITAIQRVAPVDPLELEASTPVRRAGTGFGSVMQTAVQTVENSRQTADRAVQGFLNGTGGELHSTILATQRAELQFELFLQSRNKIVAAYQEVMRVQV